MEINAKREEGRGKREEGIAGLFARFM